ncbi:MAG: hypothetical protein J6C37_10215 [Roseburia sp.]|nr:hypothetical protein [Roseburia sp.]
MRLAPIPDRRIGFVTAFYKSRHGSIEVKWNIEGDVVVYEFGIPCGVTAENSLGGDLKGQIGQGRYIFSRNFRTS